MRFRKTGRHSVFAGKRDVYIDRDADIMFGNGGQATLFENNGDSPPLLGDTNSQLSRSSEVPQPSAAQSPIATSHGAVSAAGTMQTMAYSVFPSVEAISHSFTSSNAREAQSTLSTVKTSSAVSQTMASPTHTVQSAFTPSSSSLFSSTSTDSQTITSISATSELVPSTSATPDSTTIVATATSTSGSAIASQATALASGITTVVPQSATGRSAEFYVAVAFATIVALAFLLSFAAWLLRSQKRNPQWCWGKRKEDDIEDRDLGFGLGGYASFMDEVALEKENIVSPIDSPRRSFARSSQELRHPPSLTLPLQNPFTVPLPTSFAISPYPNPRPLPVHLRASDTQARDPQILGPLHVANFMPGDTSSSSDESSRPNSRHSFNNYAELLDAGIPGSECGTPRELEAGVTPRFMGLEGRGLAVPWMHNRLPTRPPSVHSARSRASSLSVHSEKHWEDLPPLPFPSQMSNERQPDTGIEGWGASLRSGLASAISAVTGHLSRSPSTKPDDHLTPVPERAIRRYAGTEVSRTSTMRSVSSNVLDWRLEQTREDGGFVEFTPLGFARSFTPSVSTITGGGNDGVNASYTSLNSTTPLIISKKTPRQQHSPLPQQSPFADTGALTRASSMYSSASSDEAARTHSIIRGTGRPEMFARGSSSSERSISLEGSRVSDSDSGLVAKRLLAMRKRRKMKAGVGKGMGKIRASMRRGGSRKGFKSLDRRQ
ncbi:hypothetical protein BD410DRAFT_783248 [Rickenella mellea]|uniref:Uncharacterized protein n=1 Tax=Rickenella mellea TaxID=50990 RepID=A0A4Y7QIZ9_9AGAM|nr:hypothetical protein BD410DRAFT_783248 [Rickenella mellea]